MPQPANDARAYFQELHFLLLFKALKTIILPLPAAAPIGEVQALLAMDQDLAPAVSHAAV